MIYNPPTRNRLNLLFFGCTFGLLLSITALFYTSHPSISVIRSDGRGYYFYLPATFIYHDLTMNWTAPQQKQEPWIDYQWYGLTKAKDGNLLDRYTIGMAILWLAFFLVGCGVTIITHE